MNDIVISGFTPYRLLFDFVLYSVAGYVISMILRAASTGKFVNCGFLVGPYQPAVGFGAVIAEVLLAPVSESLLLLFCCSLVLGSLLQYGIGWGLEYIFRIRPWDYSTMPFHLGGYVCLRHSLMWGAAGVAEMWIFNPVLSAMYGAVSVKFGYAVIFTVAVVILIDLTLTCVAVWKLNRRLRTLSSLSETMAEYLGKEGADENNAYLQDIRRQYDQKVANKNLLQRHIIKAYPELRSKKYNLQLQEIKEKLQEIKDSSDQAAEKRVSETIAKYEETIPAGSEKPFAFGLCFSKLFWVFFAGNVIGFIVETIWCVVVFGHFEVRVGLVYGPFIPVYGFGAVVITLCLYRFYRLREIWIFLVSAVIGGAFEYLCSLFQELAFGTISWEYSDTPLNFGGRTNLMYAFCWGILGLLWVRDVYPFMSRQIERIPKKFGTILTAVLCVFMIFDMSVSSAAVARQTARREGIPAQNWIDTYLDSKFTDEYLAIIYPNMIYVGSDDAVSDRED